MKLFIAILFSVTLSSAFAEIHPKGERFLPLPRFLYQSVDGSIFETCEAKLINPDSRDYKVRCGDEDFAVHLWITRFPLSQPDRDSYEVLYWVTNKKKSQGKESGSSIWFHLDRKANAQRIEINQYLDDALNSLKLTVDIDP